MFEKEAEETVDKSTWLFPQSKELAKDFWQKGAEFGFNKANEWHKVSDKLPEMNVFVYLWTNIDNYPMIACRRKKCDEIDWYWDCQGGYYITRLVSVDEGYLWKEIILPKLKEID